MWVTSSTTTALLPTAIALGNFDGIHRGHQEVVRSIVGVDATGSEDRSIRRTVVTFNPHPREFFSGQRRQLLTPQEEKVRLLEVLGIEQLVLLPFDRELATLSPQDFVEKILVRQLQAKRIGVGKDFHFGYQRKGTAEDLRAIAQNHDIEVKIVSLQACGRDRVSSSLIRQSLQEGDIPQANRLLGRPYQLAGTVVTGQQLGRTIGFPTANLQLPDNKFLPRYGVYSVRVVLEKTALLGVMNIGCRPTVNAEAKPTVEVHLLDWSGDLYEQTLTVNLEEFLRPEQKFSSLDALKAQIQTDCQRAKDLLNSQL
ncbi:bifunctional riboflavin kinase/FAD synthetase [Lusitaniella coriacea]|uniref:bifunctional riboflavin kinase/FAD synthetase n=1 Tax=Lusitaniella coriacea TaxID=1983105 RepID=UPI003CF59CC0